MRLFHLTFSIFFVGIVAAAPLGCGGGASNDTVTTSEMLTDLKEMLAEHKASGKPAPKKLADLSALETTHQAANHALSNNKCVYFWGAELSGGPAVLAYETETPNAGGAVLLQDGTVKKMTAEEFKSAPKAGKK